MLLLVCQQTYLISCLLQLTGTARTKAGERRRWLSRWNEEETSIADPLLIISTPTRESTTLIPSLRRRSNLSAFLQARYAHYSQDTKLKAAKHSKDLLETLYLLFLTRGHLCELQLPVSALFSWKVKYPSLTGSHRNDDYIYRINRFSFVRFYKVRKTRL